MASVWQQSTAYTLGEIVVNTTMGTKWYICIKAGQSRSVTPFNNSTDEAGDVISDYQVNWLCYGKGGVGNCKLTYGSDSVVLPGHELVVTYSYGNSNMTLTRRSGTKTGPRCRVVYVGELVLQIAGILDGPNTPTEIATLRDIFENRFNSNTITVAFTGDNATKYGSSLTMMHQGSTGLRVTPLKGHRYMHKVDIQLIRVDNS